MKKKLHKVPYIYSFLYSKFLEKARGTFIGPKDLIEIIRRNFYRFPTYLNYSVIHEMEEYKLLKRINKQRYKILRSNCHKELEKLRIVEFWN